MNTEQKDKRIAPQGEKEKESKESVDTNPEKNWEKEIEKEDTGD